MAYTQSVRGNTGCLFLKGICIPFYIVSSREWILLDSGSRFVRRELEEYLGEQKIRIRAVVCSHAHFDHTENNRYLQEAHGARIVLSALDAGILENITSLKACFYSYTGQDNEQYNREMLCRADRIFVPWQQENGQIQVEGVPFQVLALPGHAASHVGFVTPDGVAYLADSVLSPDPSGREHLTYMLDWSRSFQTLEAVRRFSYQSYILAHGGVYDRIGPVAEENLERFRGMMDGFCRLFTGELTQEEVLAKAAKQYHFTSDSYEKVCVLERVVRSMTEYLVEQGRIGRRSRGGVMVYGPWKPE